ncbi:MAG: siphovirus Gp157 family protein [Eubacterium sp.]|nr:siphovirus Gp157 family protein [Eubacterium sp.]
MSVGEYAVLILICTIAIIYICTGLSKLIRCVFRRLSDKRAKHTNEIFKIIKEKEKKASGPGYWKDVSVAHKLNEIAKESKKIAQLYNDGRMIGDAFTDMFKAIELEMNFESKADGYAKIISQIGHLIDILKEEKDRIDQQIISFVNCRDSCKQQLLDAMKEIGKFKFNTAFYSFFIKNNYALIVLDAEAEIPSIFYTPQEPELNKFALSEALKSGARIKGARLEQRESLVIKQL